MPHKAIDHKNSIGIRNKQRYVCNERTDGRTDGRDEFFIPPIIIITV